MLAIWLFPTGPHPNHPLTDNSFHYHPSRHLLYLINSSPIASTFPSTLKCPRWHLCSRNPPSIRLRWCGVPSPILVQDHWESSFEAGWVTAKEPSLFIHSRCHGKVGFQLHTSSLPKNWRWGCSVLPFSRQSPSHMVFLTNTMQMTSSFNSSFTYMNPQSHGHVSMDEGPPAPT